MSRLFSAKIATNHHFLRDLSIFFDFFFGETLVLLIFAHTNQRFFYSHILFLKKTLHYEQD